MAEEGSGKEDCVLLSFAMTGIAWLSGGPNYCLGLVYIKKRFSLEKHLM